MKFMYTAIPEVTLPFSRIKKVSNIIFCWSFYFHQKIRFVLQNSEMVKGAHRASESIKYSCEFLTSAYHGLTATPVSSLDRLLSGPQAPAPALWGSAGGLLQNAKPNPVTGFPPWHPKHSSVSDCGICTVAHSKRDIGSFVSSLVAVSCF